MLTKSERDPVDGPIIYSTHAGDTISLNMFPSCK